ncbi:MAG: potassium channel protein [Acidimicrobiia bacterium]
MTLRRREAIALSVLAMIIVAGAVGFMTTEGMTIGDAVYYTFVTITTVGFAEPDGGFSTGGRIVAVGLMVGGLGTLAFAASTGLELLLDEVIGGNLSRRAVQRKVKRMSAHVILCGFGRIGREAHAHLRTLGRDIVVIESDRKHAEHAEHLGATVIVGDATSDAALREAGILRASVLVAAVASDSDNMAIILSARAIAPAIRVIARASEPANEKKLRLAGADRVVSPVTVGAERLAAMAADADITDYVDLTFEGDLVELRVEECRLPGRSHLVGRQLGNSDIREASGAIVVALRHADGRVELNPEASTTLTADSTLVGIGTDDQLAALHRLVEG